jgi:hypothetical protein
MISEKLDKTSFKFVSMEDSEADDVAYWMKKSPEERIEGIEYLRRWLYGDDQIDARIQRVFEIAKLGED